MELTYIVSTISTFAATTPSLQLLFVNRCVDRLGAWHPGTIRKSWEGGLDCMRAGQKSEVRCIWGRFVSVTDYSEQPGWGYPGTRFEKGISLVGMRLRTHGVPGMV